jgi:hypothetical protein
MWNRDAVNANRCCSMLVPYRPGTPTNKLQVKIGSRACTYAPSRVLQYRTLPPSQGELQSCDISSGSGSRLPDKKGSSAATCTVATDPLGGLRCTTCPAALDRASLIRRALALPHVPWLWTHWEGSGVPRVLRLWILREGSWLPCDLRFPMGHGPQT